MFRCSKIWMICFFINTINFNYKIMNYLFLFFVVAFFYASFPQYFKMSFFSTFQDFPIQKVYYRIVVC